MPTFDALLKPFDGPTDAEKRAFAVRLNYLDGLSRSPLKAWPPYGMWFPLHPIDNIVVNELGGNFDIRFESDASPHMFFMDAGNGEILIDASGTVTTADGTLHIHTSSAGSVDANVSMNDLVIERSTTCGMSILTANDQNSYIAFGDEDDSYIAGFVYQHASDQMQLFAGNNYVMKFTSGAVIVNEDGDDVDFRVETDANEYAFFIEGSVNGVQLRNSADLIVYSDNGSTEEMRIDGASGHIGVGQTPTATTALTVQETYTAPAATPSTVASDITTTFSEDVTNVGTEIAISPIIEGSNYDLTGGAGLQGFLFNPSWRGTGTCTNLRGFRFTPSSYTSGGTITNLYGFYVDSTAGSGTVTNNYGLYVENIVGDTLAYAIYTNDGAIRFGGTVDIGLYTNTVAAGDSGITAHIVQGDDDALTGTLRGAYISASNGDETATGTIRGAEIKGRAGYPGETGANVNVLEGLSISSDAKTYDVTTHRGAEIILDGSTGTSTLAVGLRIANNFQANRATTSYGLQIYRDSFDYTADIQLSSGGLIGGTTGDLRVNASSVIVDATGAEALLVRKDSDGGDIFTVDTNTPKIIFGADIFTDRWLSQDSNVFIGIDVAGTGNLAHTADDEGYHNTAVGYLAMQDITTGYLNTALGSRALMNITSGNDNMAIGMEALATLTDGAGNVGIGRKAGYDLTSDHNTLIGSFAGENVTLGAGNVAIGYSALTNNEEGGYNVAIGFRALQMSGGLNDISNNVGIGFYAGRTITTGTNNTLIGAYAGYGIATGIANVFIGYNAGYNETGNNQLYISNTNTATPIIWGNFYTQRVGINIGSSAAATLHIDQTSTTAAIPVLFLDQGDVSEQIIKASYSGADVDMILLDLDVTGSPQLGWSETPDIFTLNKGIAIGDGGTTDYSLFAADGILTMAGTAKVLRQAHFIFNYRRVTAQGAPTLVNQGVFYGFSLPVFGDDDEELFSCQCMPGDWDGTSDPLIYVGGWLDTANTSKKFNLQISVETADYASNDVVPATTNDYPIETTTGTWAQYTSFKVYITVDASAIGLAVGQPLAIRVRRLAASGDEIAGEVVVEGAILVYTADKLGTAT